VVSERGLIVEDLCRLHGTCVDLGQEPRLSPWAHIRSGGSRVRWSLGTLLTEWDTCHDLDKDQNLTTTYPPASLFGVFDRKGGEA